MHLQTRLLHISICSSHPQQVCQILEAALRSTLQQQQRGLITVDPKRGRVLTKAGCSCAAACVQPDASSSSSSSTVGQASGGAAAKQLFSLLASCLKAAGQLIDAVSSNRSSSNAEAGDATGVIASWKDILAAHLAASDICIQVSIASKHLSRQLLLLLCSGCLSSIARSALQLQQAASDWTAAAAADQQKGEFANQAAGHAAALAGEHLSVMATFCHTTVVDCTQALNDAGLQLLGEPQAAAKALAKLQQQGKSLQKQLQPYVTQLAVPERCEAQQLANSEAGGSSSSSSMQVPGAQSQQQQQQAFQGEEAKQLARNLQQFGDAICLQLPVSFWCCNPRCSSVQQHSELELVSGKGSRCSGCAAARFCSKACQQQCWKGQHAPVCKRIAAARRGPTPAVDESSIG
jgi:hypothetical protein